MVEVGETLAEAVRREIAEETGLTVRVGSIVKVLDRITRDEQKRVQFHYVLVDFLCRVEGGKLRAASDVSEARWVRREELAQYGLRPETLRIIEKGLEEAMAKAAKRNRKSPGSS
jgi:ADP-ribose pyrophosphatase YjhB (NUDIX family)